MVANRALTEEAAALRSAMDAFAGAPQSGSPWQQDEQAFSARSTSVADGRAKLLLYARHQAALIYVNAWDHLITLARILGGDGAMPLFSQTSVSRVVSEAAVRFAWFMDPEVSSAKRLVRGAVGLRYSAEERFKGVSALPADLLGPDVHKQMLESCRDEREAVARLIEDAGMTFRLAKKGNIKSHLEMRSPTTSVPLKVEVAAMMAQWLPDSPSWYNVASSVTHSIYWGLRDVNDSSPGQPLALTPNVLDLGAAVEAATSASALLMDRCGRMTGHDPSPYIQSTQGRRNEIDMLMRRAVASTWARIPAPPDPSA